MVRRKITYYKMLTLERRAEIAAAVGARDVHSQARFAAGQSPSSLEPSYEEEEAVPMFMAEVAAQKAPDGYETITSRKQGFGHRAVFTLVPVQSRTGTNVSIRPGSCG